MPTAKQLANLRPAKKGEVRNPAGRTPGSKNMATLAREIMEDEDFTVNYNSKAGKKLKRKYPARALLINLIQLALEGDVAAFRELRRTAYGDKVDMTVSNAESALADWHNDLKEQDEQLARDVEAAEIHSPGPGPAEQAVAPDPPVQDKG